MEDLKTKALKANFCSFDVLNFLLLFTSVWDLSLHYFASCLIKCHIGCLSDCWFCKIIFSLFRISYPIIVFWIFSFSMLCSLWMGYFFLSRCAYLRASYCLTRIPALFYWVRVLVLCVVAEKFFFFVDSRVYEAKKFKQWLVAWCIICLEV